MKNPFKFGTVVENEYFTDRIQELKKIERTLNSENHLIMISPRRFGKSSLVIKAAKETGRPYILLNLQNVVSTEDFAAKLLKAIFKIYRWEKVKHLMDHFRFMPTISTNPMNDGVDISFQPVTNSIILLEDAMETLEKVSSNEKRLIVIFDEFQEILQIEKGLDKQLRAIMQLQNNLNYIILGSQESMMEEIFERKKSPFYHFGLLLRLDKIPYNDFYRYLSERLTNILDNNAEKITDEILSLTKQHPYYTQQLASQVWEMVYYESVKDNIVETAIERLIQNHDLDYERLWVGFNRMDKRTLQMLCKKQNPLRDYKTPTSTAYSSIKRMMKQGIIIHTSGYEFEDPFFERWLSNRIN